MAFNTSLSIAQVINAAIRDTNPAASIPYLLDQMSQTTAIIQNTTDQNVTITTQWSPDGVTYSVVGTSAVINAGASLVTSQFDSTLTGLKVIAGYIKIVATAGVAPTTGNVMATLQGMNC
jgi:hypothetical protein